MKRPGKFVYILLAILLAAFGCPLGNAQIIYSNAFTGGSVTINGTAPSVANTLAGGVHNAVWSSTYTNALDGGWLANGAVGTNAGSVLLPFKPQSGVIYFLTASITLPASMNNWIGLGFAQFATPGNNPTAERFSDSNVKGGPWLLAMTPGTPEQFFGGPQGSLETDSGNVVSAAGTYTLTIVLNTTGSQWTTSAYVNGTIAGTNVVGGTQLGTNIVYATNPNIGYVGLTQQAITTSGVQWNSLALSAVILSGTPTNYWAAPAAIGSGNGSSPANAAGYLNSSFWNNVQTQLQSSNVTVNLVDGNYNAGTLSLTDMGNPLHRLVIQALDPFAATMNTTGNTIINLVGSQNIEFQGIVFNGACSSWGIDTQPDYLKPCRDLEFSGCQFLNLTNAYYGAIGLVNGVRDVTVDNCTFTNITSGGEAHMIYGSHDIVGVIVTNCVFQDCKADYVRFRDDSEYCTVKNCTFISTLSATAYGFITSPLFNGTDPGPGNEFFGTYFQISGNSFTYNVSAGTRAALEFSDSGYNPQSYNCALTSSQASQLSGGTGSFQQSFLQTNLGIAASGIKMSGNTYNSRVAYQAAYAYSYSSTATNAPQNGWQGIVGIPNVPDSSGAVMGPAPVVRNGNFDRQGLLELPMTSSTPNECLFQTWFANPKYTDILWHPGFNGTTNALRFDGTKSQYIYQWISHPGSTWTMDCLFAIGSGFTGSGTKFKVDIFHDDLAGSKVSIGVDNLGRFGIYNGGTFTVLPELGTVAFSVDNNGNGYYNDPGDVLNVYRLRIVGNYGAATPSVNIYTSAANSRALNHQSPGHASWVTAAPVSGQSTPSTVAFYNYTAPVVLDQVAFAPGLAEQPPVINNVSAAPGQLILSGTNGFPGDIYYLLSATNLATAGNWTIESSNTFDANGFFSITNVPTPGAPQTFYRLQLQ